MMENYLEYIKSKCKDVVLCKYWFPGAIIPDKTDDYDGIDIQYKNLNIDTKYQAHKYIWFEENKLKNNKTTKILVFHCTSDYVIDIDKTAVLSIIKLIESLKDGSIGYIENSKHEKTKNGKKYTDILCYVNPDWLKDKYSSIFRKIDPKLKSELQYVGMRITKKFGLNTSKLKELENIVSDSNATIDDRYMRIKKFLA